MGDDETTRGRPKLGGNLKTLLSFVLVDNVWAFLKNPVSSTTRTVHQGVQWTGTIIEPRLRDKGTTFPELTNAPGMDLIAWERWLDRHTDTPRERGSIRLLLNGEGFYPAFERRMDQLVTHPVFDYRISYRRVLEVQARLFSRVLLGELPRYPEFRIR